MFLFQYKQAESVPLGIAKIKELRSNLGDPPSLFYWALGKGTIKENMALPPGDDRRVVESYNEKSNTVSIRMDRLEALFKAAYPDGVMGTAKAMLWRWEDVENFIMKGVVPKENKSMGQKSIFTGEEVRPMAGGVKGQKKSFEELFKDAVNHCLAKNGLSFLKNKFELEWNYDAKEVRVTFDKYEGTASYNGPGELSKLLERDVPGYMKTNKADYSVSMQKDKSIWDNISDSWDRLVNGKTTTAFKFE